MIAPPKLPADFLFALEQAQLERDLWPVYEVVAAYNDGAGGRSVALKTTTTHIVVIHNNDVVAAAAEMCRRIEAEPARLAA